MEKFIDLIRQTLDYELATAIIENDDVIEIMNDAIVNKANKRIHIKLKKYIICCLF